MKHGVLTIFRKELARFFGDKRMAFTTILLPGLLIFFLYSFMGTALTDQFTVDEDYTPVIYTVNLPESVSVLAEQANLVFDEISAAEAEEVKSLISAKETDMLAVFPSDFEAAIAAYTRQRRCSCGGSLLQLCRCGISEHLQHHALPAGLLRVRIDQPL